MCMCAMQVHWMCGIYPHRGIPCMLLQFTAASVGCFSEFEAFAMARKLFGAFVEQALWLDVT